MAHSSTIQILKVVNETREKKDKTSSYQVRYAVCNILLDDGTPECAGNLPLPEALVTGLVPGLYRAGFSMGQVTWGDKRGDIVSQLVSLTPVQVRGVPPPVSRPAAAAAAAAAAV